MRRANFDAHEPAAVALEVAADSMIEVAIPA
jgi:hypothetical protein